MIRACKTEAYGIRSCAFGEPDHARMGESNVLHTCSVEREHAEAVADNECHIVAAHITYERTGTSPKPARKRSYRYPSAASVGHVYSSAAFSSFSLDSSSRARRFALSNTSAEGMPVLALERKVIIVPTMSATRTTMSTTTVTMSHFASGGFMNVPY